MKQDERRQRGGGVGGARVASGGFACQKPHSTLHKIEKEEEDEEEEEAAATAAA